MTKQLIFDENSGHTHAIWSDPDVGSPMWELMYSDGEWAVLKWVDDLDKDDPALGGADDSRDDFGNDFTAAFLYFAEQVKKG